MDVLQLVDQSGPLTLAAGRRIIDLEKNGNTLATIQFAELAGEYVLHIQGGLTVVEAVQAVSLMMTLNQKYR